MANYPFKINITTKDDLKYSFYTASFATDADTVVSASVMVDRINNMKSGSNFVDSIEAPTSLATHGSTLYGAAQSGVNNGIHWLSASFDHPNTGSITFTDTETAASGGLDFYTFHGTKVCSVLGLPEGIPIYTENFKLSDSSTDTTNYISGEFVSDSVALKKGFKMSSQARMRSNLIWDDAFGEGFVQWVSGSDTKMSIGYDNVADVYRVNAPQITGSVIRGTLTGNVTGNLTGVASNATTLNYIGSHTAIGTVSADPSDATATQLIFSGSQSNVGNGGDIVLQAGHNMIGNTFGAEVKGGDVVLRGGGAGHFGALTAPGTVNSGSVRVEGVDQTKAPILTIQNKMTSGIASGTDLGFINFDTYGEVVTVSPGFNNSGSEQSNQTIGQIKMMSNSNLHRGGGDRPTSMLFSVHDDGDHSAALNEVMRLVFQENTFQMQVTGSARVLHSLFVGDADTPSSTQGLIEAENDVIAFSSSDKRFKENLTPIKGSLNKLTSISGYEFDWIPNDKHHAYGDRHDVGVIAQEVEKVLPEVVKTRDSGFKAVKYEKMIPLLIEGIKEQQEQIDELKKEIEELKNA